ncbi:MAG: hypothetical protein NTY69_11340 [Methylococcales bacterium]|nr:hypothetical protein [Methylococcales bacterium]
MSTEENTSPEEVVQQEPVTSTESVAPAADSAPSAASGAFASFLSLKESNPKVFFGAIGGVALILIVLFASGGDGNKPALNGPVIKNLEIGQVYHLKSANAYDPSATVRLVSTPGAIAAYDDTEEADRNGACQHIAQGTSVRVLEFADAYGKQKTYTKVKVEDGSCQNTEAWALSIDIQ